MVNITAFLLQYATATSTAPSIPSSTSVPSFKTPPFLHQSISEKDSLLTLDPSLPHLCDWTREAFDCRDYEFVRWMLVTSAILHAVMGTFCMLLLVYRNRGWNRKVVTELFSMVGTGIRPKPMDCIIFFVCIACFIKVPANLILVFDVLRDSWWLRVAIEQMYWVMVSFAFSTYFVGLLYAMPVTTREGIFAVYQPETSYGAKPLRPIHVLTPTTFQKNCMLATGAIYPLIGAGIGIASGAMHDVNQPDKARILILAQYSNWALIHFSLAVMFFYYGLKYTFILRANIIIAEQALKAPRAAFGIGNLISRSPARFLFIQLQITGFGGSAVMILAGFLCLIWVLFHDKILTMQQPNLPRAMGFFWTCAIAVAYFVIMILITVQSIKNRRRGINNNTSTTTTCSPHPSSGRLGPATGTKASAHKGSNSQSHSGGISSNAVGPLDSSKGGRYMSSDPEACLSQVSSNDLSTLHSVVSDKSDKHSMEKAHDSFYEGIGSEELTMHAATLARGGAGGSAKGYESDRDSLKAPASLTPPPRPLPAPLSLNYGLSYGDAHGRNQYGSSSPTMSPTSDSYSIGSHHFSLLPTGPSPSQIRESVFGGRTPREETSSSSSRDRTTSPPPQSPTSPTSPTSPLSGGFHLPSFHRSSHKPGKRNSVTSRPSISSLRSAASTAATTTPASPATNPSTRTSNSPSTQHPQQRLQQHQSQMSSLSLSTTLTNSSIISVQASPPSSSGIPQPLRQLSQPLPGTGAPNGGRKKSSAGLVTGSSSPATATSSTMSLSAPIPSSSASASRGAGGGYKNHGIEMVNL
ncbi:hypothetical protein EMPS_07496 [Entomortierella parvispora]|uniref:Uncharacterized protein n=1 Tax=Entomortierella parvispora TaxID=205924 RepID=A0A9P3HF10_9FUNG|nr:hypothetical protein EMPS_07496 [Entomortierella parvispora]